MQQTVRLGYVFFLALVAALGGLLFGYDTAVISGTIDQVGRQFNLDVMNQGWYVGCALIGSIAGVSVAGIMSDRLGRKPTMFISAVLFTVSAAGCAISTTFTMLVVYRIIGGVGIGIISIVAPVYISEIAITRYRGQMVSLYQLAVTVGFLAAYFVNYLLLNHSLTTQPGEGWISLIFVNEVWRGMLGMETLPALFFLLIIMVIPESPRWLIVKNRVERARGIYGKMYLTPEGVNQQVDDTRSMISAEVKSEWGALLQPGILKAVVIGVCIAILGQFMGVNAVLYYGPSIFKDAGIGDPLLCQVLVGVVNTVTTIIAMLIIDRVGRKKLIYYGRVGHDCLPRAHSCLFRLPAAVGPLGLLHAHLLPALCVLLRHQHQCRGVRAPLGDVSQQRARSGNEHRRSGSLDRHLPHWSAHTLDARHALTGRHFRALRCDVCALHAHHVASGARDRWHVA